MEALIKNKASILPLFFIFIKKKNKEKRNKNNIARRKINSNKISR
jgi:hypothetical protein